LLTVLLTVFLLLASCNALASSRPKIDVVTLINGDRLTCEIIGLNRGKLSVKPSGMGTVDIEWNKISRLESSFWYLLQLNTGVLVYGQMPDSEQDHTLLVVFKDRITEVKVWEVVEITAIRYNWSDKFSLSFALGFNTTRSSGVSQFNVDASTAYQGRIHSGSLSWDSMVTHQSNDDATERHNVALQYQRLVSGDWWGYLTAQGESNEEMGLELRILGGAGLGYFLKKTNTTQFAVGGGLNTTREWSISEELVENNLEGKIFLEYSIFIFDTPETDLTITLAGMPSITNSPRFRYDINAAITQEIFKDFFVTLKYFENYDSDPPPGANIQTDRGVVFSIGWSK